MKIATWNVNGIRARQEQVTGWVAAERPDVLCLQELKAAPDQIPAALCEMDGYWCYWHGIKGYSGVGLHVSKRLAPTRPHFFHPDFDHEHRIVCAEVEGVTVASIYVPNGGKDYPAKVRFLEAMAGLAAGLRSSGKAAVFCGDMNVARSEMDVHPKERKPVIGQLPEERALIETILQQGLIDVGRQLRPDDDQMFTWWAPWRNMRQRNVGWRLDYLFASTALATTASDYGVYREVGTSDHAPVVATFSPR